jgi:hypothetical protein
LGFGGFSILGRLANGSSGKSEMACLFLALVGGTSICFLNEHRTQKKMAQTKNKSFFLFIAKPNKI